MGEKGKRSLPIVIEDDDIGVKCPACGAVTSNLEFQDIEITWDDENNRYLVKCIINMECPSDGYKESLILSKIPVTMAKNTTCTCGSNMKLTNHSLNKKGNILEFSGEYVCERCEKSKNTFIQKIGRSLISFWAKTKKISIGTTGVTYEKEGSG